jgi:hypothetical protein
MSTLLAERAIVRHDAGLRRIETLILDYWAELVNARRSRPRAEATMIEAALRDLIDVRRTLQGRP